MKKVNASHAEFVGCADKLRVMSGDVSGDAWAAMQKGAHKLEQAAVLMDVFADTIRGLQAERDELKAELGAVRRAWRGEREGGENDG